MKAIDGGARYGIHESLDSFQYFGTIKLFEPETAEYNRLKHKYSHKKNIEVRKEALGSNNENAELNVLKHEALSTIYAVKDKLDPINSRQDQYHKVRTNDIIIKRLDEILDKAPDFIKLDIEGMELEALKGCGSLLDHVVGIRCECVFRPFFKSPKSVIFRDLDLWLDNRGFNLISIDDMKNGRQTSDFSINDEDGRLISADAIWINSKIGNELIANEKLHPKSIAYISWLFINNLGSEAVKCLIKAQSSGISIRESVGSTINDDLKHLQYLMLVYLLKRGNKSSYVRKELKSMYEYHFGLKMPDHYLIRFKVEELSEEGSMANN